jgi:spermidine synthase
MDQALGRHVIAELYDCHPLLLNEVVKIEQCMVSSAQQAGATVIHAVFHHFAPYGVSGVVVIQESHLAIHTWPEYGFAAVDIFTCGTQVNPWVALDALKKGLKAGHVSAIEMTRGQLHLLPEPLQRESATPTAPEPHMQRRITRDLWFTERAGEIALSVKHEGEMLYQLQSQRQRIEVLQTPSMGRMLLLDGVIASTELDEFVAHELSAHIPLLTHKHPKKILVLGGGDGGTVRELLKHAQIEEIWVVEYDEAVVKCSQQLFSSMGEALLHPKVKLLHYDVHSWLGQQPHECFDVIIADAYNPANMTSQGWLPNIYRLLRPNGVAWVQLGSPWVEKNALLDTWRELLSFFGKGVHACHAYIPSYPTGMWMFACCCKGEDSPAYIDKMRQQDLLSHYELQYYNEEVQQQAFALPTFVKKLLR